MSCRYTLLDTAVIANPIEMACCTASDEPEQGLDGDLILTLIQKRWERDCPTCGRRGSMVLEESEFDSGDDARWVAASGCWGVEHGTLGHKCRMSKSA